MPNYLDCRYNRFGHSFTCQQTGITVATADDVFDHMRKVLGFCRGPALRGPALVLSRLSDAGCVRPRPFWPAPEPKANHPGDFSAADSVP